MPKFPPHLNYNFFQQGQWLLGTGLLALAVFIVLPESYGLMVSWPWVTLWQLGFLAIAAWLLWRLRQFQFPFRLLGHHLDWAVGLSAASVTLSSLFAFKSQPSFWYLAIVGGYGFTLYALTNWLTGMPKASTAAEVTETQFSSCRRWWLLNGLGIGGLLTSGISVLLWGLYKDTFTEPVNPYPLGHHNFVAGYLVLTLPVLFVLGWRQENWLRWLWFGGTGLAIAALYTTGSRGGALGFLTLLGLGTIILFIETWNVQLSRQQKSKILAAIGVSSSVLLTCAALLLANPRVQRLISAVLSGHTEGNAQFRLFSIEAGIRLWQQHPWLGIGLGNTIKLYDVYRPIEAGITAFRVQQLHCTPIQFLAELGLLGLGTYFLWIVLLLSLSWKLIKHFKQQSFSLDKKTSDRLAVYGCSAGLLGYTISSLTDFQLENIAISLTVVALIAVLASLGDQFSTPPVLIKTSLRRLLSLAGFTLALAALRIWIPNDAAMMLAYAGNSNLQAGNLSDFYRQWSTAAKIVPWEPYYQFQLGAQLADIIAVRDSVSTINQRSTAEPTPSRTPQLNLQYQQQIAQLAQSHLQQAVALASADELFNRYLGSWLIDRSPKQAVDNLRRAAQLTPRKLYTYALMGTAYFNQRDYSKATKAFALEGFVNPEFLTTEVWLDPDFKALQPQVIQQALALYRQCLSRIAPNDPSSDSIAQNMSLLEWWTTPKATSTQATTWEMQHFSPIAQVIVLIDQGQNSQALDLLNQLSLTGAAQESIALLQAWLEPQKYLGRLQEHIQTNTLKDATEALQTSMQQHRQIRPWLISMHSYTKAISERVGFFSYRNTNGPDFIEMPRSLPINVLVHNLKLFNSVGVMPVFDQTLVAAQKDLLSLDRPSLTQFSKT
ncbi:O-antigen ligase family protein [Trichocoleus desertorum AS-A10]|uniref:O-antigen ligase family protein n=1 Tax=Trichocoleus desertorum TaxID=1481672 RepID=UPI0032975AAC